MDMNLNPVNAAAQAMNAPAESAQGLASLGRNNDSMLMHVTPNEVQGLQQLAQNMGGSLTRNPQTGLPEAGFFDFIGNMLPTIAGLGVGIATGNPYLAGTAAGTTKTIQTGDIGAGILSGFGAYMGADAIKGVENFGANAVAGGTDNAVGAFNAEALNNAASSNAPFMPPVDPTYAPAATLPPVQGLETGSSVASTGPNFGLAPDASGGYVPGSSFTETTLPAADVASTAPAFGGDFGAGISKMTEPGGFDAYAQSIGKSPMSAGMGLALPAIGTVAGMMPPPAMAEEEDSGWGPFTTSAQRRQMRDSGTMKLAEGGPILNDGTGLAGLLDKRVGNEGEAGGTAEYFSVGGLKEGAFILPADVVSHYGNGSSKAGLALLANKLNAKPIHGPGDGMSDGIPTTIEGKQKARVADGEAYISPADVKRIGGPKKLYAMMDKIREARTGTKKQGKQINPGKYLPT
jgi:hypothetical protein